ncbi:MAG TPA: helix-turn-helix domain-containing protein [Candidatus Binataceae bacterium]|nr:helix-turn-helix domain-containing protein [Candidatus Binataceae bacterium]
MEKTKAIAKLRRIRRLSGLTQAELAERAAISRPAVAAIESDSVDRRGDVEMLREAYGLGFILLREERYDLAIPDAELESAPVRRRLDALNSRRFAHELAQPCAHDTARMGEELARIDC